ncbi:MAG: hypothetical protein ACRD96_15255 [Bryobacteraceae bacterium]
MNRLLWAVPIIFLAGCAKQEGDEKAVQAAGFFSRTTEYPVPAGTVLKVRLGETLDTSVNRAGETFTATLDEAVVLNEKTVLPKGTRFDGRITGSQSSGRLKGRAVLSLSLDSFELQGLKYKIETAGVSRASGGHKKRNWTMIGGGSGAGAAIGAIAGGGTGALIGAGAGAAAGTAGAAFTGKKNVRIPVETPLTFSLRSPVQVKVKS